MNKLDLPEMYNPLTQMLEQYADFKPNPFHPLVFIHGEPEIGENTYIGLFSEINARGGAVQIGENCDIASFVSINVADSHLKTIGCGEMLRGKIIIEDNVFIGSHSFIGGNTTIGNNSVIGAGSIVINKNIPPYSLVLSSSRELIIKPDYFVNRLEYTHHATYKA